MKDIRPLKIKNRGCTFYFHRVEKWTSFTMSGVISFFYRVGDASRVDQKDFFRASWAVWRVWWWCRCWCSSARAKRGVSIKRDGTRKVSAQRDAFVVNSWLKLIEGQISCSASRGIFLGLSSAYNTHSRLLNNKRISIPDRNSRWRRCFVVSSNFTKNDLWLHARNFFRRCETVARKNLKSAWKFRRRCH